MPIDARDDELLAWADPRRDRISECCTEVAA